MEVMKGTNEGDVIAYIRINAQQYPDIAAKVIRLKAQKRLNAEFRKLIRNAQGQQELPL